MDDLESRFGADRAAGSTVGGEVREEFLTLARTLDDRLPDGPYLSTAVQHLESAWHAVLSAPEADQPAGPSPADTPDSDPGVDTPDAQG